MLFLSSYSYDWETVPLQIEGITSTLEESVELQYEFMNTKHIRDELAYEMTYRTLKEEVSHGQTYDAIIVGDDAALYFAMTYQDEFFHNIPIVFEGINDLDRAIDAGLNDYITGVVEKLSYSETIDLAQTLYPRATTLVGIVDDTITGVSEQKQFMNYKTRYPNLTFLQLNSSYYTQREFCQKLKEVDRNSIVMYLSLGEDSNHSKYTTLQQIAMMQEWCKAPIFRMNQVGISEGLLGGIIVSHRKLGEIAAGMVNDIFAGKAVRDIPVELNSPNYPCFDYRIMKAYGISMRKIPKNSIVMNKEESFFERNPQAIIPAEFILGICSIVLLFILWDNIRRRRITNLLIDAQGHLENLMDDIPGGICMIERVEERIRNLYFNDGLCEMFHYTREEMEEQFSWKNKFSIHHEDWESVQFKLRECHELNSNVNIIFRRRLKEGNYRWTNLKAKIIEQDNAPIYYCVFIDVNQEKENELQVKNEHQKFQIALDNMSLTIWEYDIINSRRIQTTQCEYLSNFPNVIENYPECVIESGKLHKDSIEMYRTLHRKIREGAASVIGEVQIRTLEDQYVWYRVKYITIYNHLKEPVKAIGISEDISLQEKYKEELFKIQEICNYAVQNEYSHVFAINLLSNSVRIFFENGRNVGYVENQPYYEIYNQHFNKVVPMDQPIFEDYMKLNAMIYKLEENFGTITCTYQYSEDNQLKWAECKYTYFGNNRDTILVLISDISQILLHEKKSKEALEKALTQAKEAARAKEDFLAYMSHEIRTPLNGIKGMLDLLKQKDVFCEERYLDEAITSARHLSGLINDILDMSRIDSGKLMLQKTYTNNEDILHYVNAVIKPMAEEKGILFTHEYKKAQYDQVHLDQGRLQQILINILANAVKYTNNAGCITLKVNEKKVGNGKLRLNFIVEDNGIGMSKEFLERAYEPFEQANHSFSNIGSGLGLSITKKLVEAMEGTIQIESELEKGTKVTIVLPADGINRDDRERQMGKTKIVTVEENAVFPKVQALLVEDNELNREIAKMQLESMKISVKVAINGKEAIQLFQESEEGTFDIIFMDIMMPVMDGLTATKEIRKLKRKDVKQLPIVAMTANAFADDVHKSLESGMNYHLSKPFEKKQMIRILAQEFLSCEK